jgi:RNA polymerase sigma-70 factor (ECF subfamily)
MGLRQADNIEERILDNFRNGKLAPLYRFLYPSLLLYACKYLKDNEQYYAEDFVQNAIFNAWKNKARFNGMSGLKSFLYTAIRNECISYLRKQGARSRYEARLLDAAPCDHEGLALEADVSGIIFGIVQGLPARERIVLEMSFFEGKSNIEIALALNLSDSTVKKRKARALDMLRKRLASAIAI